MCLVPKQDPLPWKCVRDGFRGGTTEIYVVTELLTNDPGKTSACVYICCFFFF